MALEQVFLYVTQQCNIRCLTCYALDQLERGDDLGLDDLLRLLRALRAKGAWRLTFLGGEPTMYRALGDVVAAARAMGFSFLRINTNGLFNTSLLRDSRMKGVDVWCFSIDGATPAVNDAIRKGGRLDRTITTMRLAAELGYDVRANVTVTSRNIGQLFEIIALVQDAGGVEVNINVVLLMGYALEHRELCVAPDEWRRTYQDVVRRHREFSVRIKLPPAFATADEVDHHRGRGHRCLAKDGGRLYVASNGDAYPCLTFMDDPARRVGAYADGGAVDLPSPALDDDRVHDFCQFITRQADGVLPLCVFYKDRLDPGSKT